MKPYIHAKNSAHKYGGQPSDYQALHDQMDASKSAHATMKHRVIFHSAFGIYLVEKIFGTFIVNSDQTKVQTRDLAEDHVLEDLGMIPSLEKWLDAMPIQQWMGGPTRKHKFVRID